MGMPKAEVILDNNKYSFYLLGGMQAYLKMAKYGGNFSKLIASLLQQDIETFNNILNNILDENELMNLFKDFVADRSLCLDGEPIKDLNEFFAGKPSLMYKLLFEAIKANDKDFFTSLPTLIDNLVGKITERLQASSLQNPEEEEQSRETLEALNNLANKAKSAMNLG